MNIPAFYAIMVPLFLELALACVYAIDGIGPATFISGSFALAAFMCCAAAMRDDEGSERAIDDGAPSHLRM